MAHRFEEGNPPVANVLSDELRLRVLAALVDGNSIRAVERMTEVHRDTIMRFGVLVGSGAQRLHDRLVRDLSCTLIEVDEQWGYVHKKQSRVDPAKDGSDVGEAWTWAALDSTSRLAVTFHVGKRDQASADAFTADLRSRLAVMPQITSDGLALYERPIGASFGPGVDYEQVIKNYRGSGSRGPVHRYEPARGIDFLTKRAVYGSPDMKRGTTAHLERQNLTMRHVNGRLRRLCLAFSKKLDNHRAAVALAYTWYNLGHVVKTLRVTPAMAAGITDHVWTIEEFMVAALDLAPVEKPVAGPLAHRVPATTSRELPGGRGFLRVVGGTSSPSGPVPTSPVPMPPSVAAGEPRVHVTVPVASGPAGQLDLLAWVAPAPKLRAPVQLDLFGLEIDSSGNN
jgi:IS1 family transposase